MIRYSHINNLVLRIYTKLPDLSFPLNPQRVVALIPNCRYMSYSDFATATHTSVKEIITLCESCFGCTHYEISKNRYLILCNESFAGNNNLGRQRWTLAHELGHVLCRHLEHDFKSASYSRALDSLTHSPHEMEADCFARTLLAPMPLISHLKISSVAELQSTFGLSSEASINVYKGYIKWKANHYKTAWEDNLIYAYITKQKNR